MENKFFNFKVSSEFQGVDKINIIRQLLNQANYEFGLINTLISFKIKTDDTRVNHLSKEMVVHLFKENEKYSFRFNSIDKGRFWYNDYRFAIEVFNRYFHENGINRKLTICCDEIKKFERETPKKLNLLVIYSNKNQEIKGQIISRIKGNPDTEIIKLEEVDDKISWYEDNEIFDNLSMDSIERGKQLSHEYFFHFTHEILRCFNNLIFSFQFGILGLDYIKFIEQINKITHQKLKITEAKQINFENRTQVTCLINGQYFESGKLPLEVSSELILQFNHFLNKNSLYNFYWWKFETEDRLNFIFMRNQYYRFYFKDYGPNGEFKEITKEVIEIHERRKIQS